MRSCIALTLLLGGCGVSYQPASATKQFAPGLDDKLQVEVETQTDEIGQQKIEETNGAQPPDATVRPAYIKDRINSLAEVRKRMRANVYSYENDLGKDASLLPFFTITAAQKSELKSRSSVGWDMVQYWTDIANDKNIEYPRLWQLRPDKSLTGDKLFAQIPHYQPSRIETLRVGCSYQDAEFALNNIFLGRVAILRS